MSKKISGLFILECVPQKGKQDLISKNEFLMERVIILQTKDGVYCYLQIKVDYRTEAPKIMETLINIGYRIRLIKLEPDLS